MIPVKPMRFNIWNLLDIHVLVFIADTQIETVGFAVAVVSDENLQILLSFEIN